MNLESLKVKIYADGANLSDIKSLAEKPWVKGFTTNPTLMRKVGITDYKEFSFEALKIVGDRPISFEVFADDLETMEKQALEITRWSENVYVKIPVMNTKREFTGPIIKSLAAAGVKLNITAIFTEEQIREVTNCLSKETAAIVSVFAGRIADTGVDPLPLMTEAKKTMASKPKAELLWASPRELLNVIHADQSGCDIITATSDILAKLSLFGKDLFDYSQETVEMFYRDAKASAYSITTDGHDTVQLNTKIA